MKGSKIVLTGPESSGKTTLAQQLSLWYGFPMVPEYARKWMEGQNRAKEYSLEDVVRMSFGQIQMEKQMASRAESFIVCDTDLLTYQIWIEDKFDHRSSFLQSWRPFDDRVYLLCRPDLDWESDPFREDPHRREVIFEMYHSRLQGLDVRFRIIEGKGSLRLQNLIERLDQIL